MTDTITRGAANQAGAHVNKDAYAEAKDFLPLNGVDHVEFWVGNAKQAAHYFRALWGFTPDRLRGPRDRHARPLQLRHAPERHHDRRHRRAQPGRRDRGARPPPRRRRQGHRVRRRRCRRILARDDDPRRALGPCEFVELDGGEDGVLRRSAVGTYGEVRHSFIDRRDYHGVFAPGYRRIKKPARAATGLSLLEIDHCVGNVELGDMNKFVDYYRDVFGFAQLIHYDDKVIHTEYSALMSKVMTNGNGRIKFPINEPASGKKKSQIQEFLDYYLDNGTQHIALRTEDIVATVRQLRENGVEFLGMPHAYYETLADRVGDVGVPIATLEELGIEADRDEEGYLLQIFTRPDPGSPDVLLRDHRAPRLAGLRRRQLQGALRGDRDRTGAAREPLARLPRPASRLWREPDRVDDRLSSRPVLLGGVGIVIDHDDHSVAGDVQDPELPSLAGTLEVQVVPA